MLPDVQQSQPGILLPINRVGIRGVEYPVTLLSKGGLAVNTVASVAMSVSLPKYFKGTHMSRFIEVLTAHHDSFDLQQLEQILDEILLSLGAEAAYLVLAFPYFTLKVSPVSKLESLMEYRCMFSCRKEYGQYRALLAVDIPITTVCPCSKEISDRGAHSQRAIVDVKVYTENQQIWIEDLVKLVEGCGSCDIYSLLKREDEKYVTEKAYDHPMFVEDVVRAVADKLNQEGINEYIVETTSAESIHNHSAYARIQKGEFE